MAILAEFTKSDEVNGTKYKKGDIQSLSERIFARLSINGTVKVHVAKKRSSKTRSSKTSS